MCFGYDVYSESFVCWPGDSICSFILVVHNVRRPDLVTANLSGGASRNPLVNKKGKKAQSRLVLELSFEV